MCELSKGVTPVEWSHRYELETPRQPMMRSEDLSKNVKVSVRIVMRGVEA